MTNTNNNTLAIKILALIFMLIDHIGATILPNIIELRIIGRIAFPLFAWCMVLGADYTRNIYKYIMRVLLIGIISQPIYCIALNHTWEHFNIMFTLCLGLISIASIKYKKYYLHIIVPIICLALTSIINVDYGFNGVLFIILLYLSKDNRKSLISFMIAFCIYWGSNSMQISNILGMNIKSNIKIITAFTKLLSMQTFAILSLPIMLYNSKRSLKLHKLLNYLLYPLHLVLLIILKIIFTGGLNTRILLF